jgi:ribosome biogenesis GTPase / thiamine phosphate phosphatase
LPKPRRQQAKSSSRSSGASAVQTIETEFVPPSDTIRGTVIRSHGLWHEVTPPENATGQVVIATVRGGLKRERRGTDVVAVGDRVWYRLLPDDEAVIEAVEPRVRTLGRVARHTRDVEQVILANPDQVYFVFAIHQPEPHLRMLDRFIILAELQEIPIQLIITKMDLDGMDGSRPARELFGEYVGTYPLHFVSTLTGEGMDALLDSMRGRISVVAGPSGVGKSSLLNILDPEVDRQTSTVSTATGKGRHTTVGSRLHMIGGDTFVADTPGMRSLVMAAVDPKVLDWCYREFRPFLGDCFYADCTHDHEPDCAIRAAVEAGTIPAGRYESYLTLRRGDELQVFADTW